MAVNLGTLTAHIGGNTRDLDRALGRSRRSIDGFVGGGRAGLAKLSGAFAALGVSVGAGMIFKNLVQGGAQFQQTMTTAGAVMRATGVEMEALTAIAREMGETTEWTATQAGDALQFLGMAGFQAAEAITALPGVLDLATAGSLDLGRAADIASNALTAMGLDVEELGRVNDVFVGTITRSNTNMEMMAESFKYAAPIGKVFGYSIEELSGLIGTLGNAGIQGSMAGTQLAMAMQKANDIAVKFGLTSSDLVDVLEQLRAKGLEDAQIMKLFGLRAGRAAGVLLGAIEATKEFQETLGGVGGEAETLANKMRDTLGGAFKELRSVVESVGLDIFATFGDNLKNLVKDITSWIRENKIEIVGFADTIIKTISSIGEAVKLLSDILTAIPRATAGVFNSVRDQAESAVNNLLQLAVSAQGAFIPPPLGPWQEFFWQLDIMGRNLAIMLQKTAEAIGNFIGALMRLVVKDLLGNIALATYNLGSAFELLVRREFAAASESARKAWEEIASIPIEAIETGRIWDESRISFEEFMDAMERRSPAQIWADQWMEDYARISAGLMGPPKHLAGIGGGVHVPKPVVPGFGEVGDSTKQRMKLLQDEVSLYDELMRSGQLSLSQRQQFSESYLGAVNKLVIAQGDELEKVLGLNDATAVMVSRMREAQAEVDKLFAQSGAIEEAFGKIVLGLSDMTTQVTHLISGAFRQLEDDILDVLRDSRNNFADFFDYVYREIQRLILRQLFLKPLAEMGESLNWKGLLGFQHGGSFQVGGAGGADSQLVAFRATPGERVDVSSNGGRRGNVTVIQNIKAQDFPSMQRSRQQIEGEAYLAAMHAARRNS